jgi:hypothetical protein
MELQQLIELIKSEYVTVAQFCRVTGRDYYDTNKFFIQCRQKMTVDREQEILILADDANRYATDDHWITEELKLRIKRALKQYGSMRKFCRDHNQYSYQFVNMVVNRGKRRTEKVNNLLKTLGIKNK